jgi:hypothetical protein
MNQGMGFGFGVKVQGWGLGFQVSVWGLGFRLRCLGFRGYDSGAGGWGLGIRG